MSIVDFPTPPKSQTKRLDEIEFDATPDLGKPYIDVNDPLDCKPPMGEADKNDILRYKEDVKAVAREFGRENVFEPMNDARKEGFVPSPAAKICQEAAALLDGSRARQHGDKIALHRTMAGLFTAYLGQPIKPSEAAMLECLMKAARTRHGLHNPDDYRDGAAYFGIAMECADVGC